MRWLLLGVTLGLLLAGCDRQERAVTISCERAAALRLTAPSSAEYGNALDVAPPGVGDRLRRMDDNGIITTGNGQGAWYGFVDSDNAFGTSQRNYFICVVDDSGATVSFGELDEVLAGY